MKKKMSFALVCAIVMTLVLGSAAVAAGLSLLEHFAEEREWDQPWVSERLEKVQENIVRLNKTIQIETPSADLDPSTVKEQLSESLFGQQLELTISDVYCDGSKLYYTYTFKHDPSKTFKGEGWPEGFEKDELKKFYDKWEYVDGNGEPTFGNLAFAQEESDWYKAHDASWFAAQTFFVGDGLDLPDGTSLQIWDSYAEAVDENTTRGYYEVELPKDYKAGETVDVVMTVLYNVNVGYSDATGVYWGAAGAGEEFGNKVTSFVRIPLTIPVTDKVTSVQGSGEFDTYKASADVKISKFDVTGKVSIHPEKPWKIDEMSDDQVKDNYLFDYMLISGGVEYEDYWAAKSIPLEDGSYEIEMRFDLPEDTSSLSLRPVYRDGTSPENEVIVLK